MAIDVVNYLDRLPDGWKPQSKAQKMALSCPAELLCYGGAVGSLKSETVLVDALKYIQNPYRAVLFRKTYPEMEFLIDRSRYLYSQSGGSFKEGPKEWRWRDGQAVIQFRHMDSSKDVYKHQGPAYQYIAFDESTHQEEFAVRYLLNSRMRSTEGIPLRMRLATNPGNIGAAWHKYLFHGKRCIHCTKKMLVDGMPWPKDVREYGKIYHDARWQSDKGLINHSTCYIPGKVSDHALLGEGYLKKLRGLPLVLQEALIEGCWEAFEGQYFDIFDIKSHVIERASLAERSWWPYWAGVDYGFRHACVAYLFTKAPNGTVYVLDELVTHRTKGTDVADLIHKRWGDSYNLKAVYLSPEAFEHDGKTDFSQAELMAQATGDMYDKAYNSRVSGWLLCYELLANNRMFITEDCPLLIESIPTRVHDEKNDGDLAKQEDDGDDAVDAWRYGVASEISPGTRPEAEVIQEKIDAGEWGSDPTSQAMNRMLYENQRGERESFTYRQRGPRRARSRPSLFNLRG
jgi:hypothetical protein